MIYTIAKDFSRYPGPRYKNQGPYSGETLSKKLSKKLSETDEIIEIILDGTVGYNSSFLDEAFGGLVRRYKYSKTILKQRLKFISQIDPSYIEEIWDSINTAEPA